MHVKLLIGLLAVLAFGPATSLAAELSEIRERGYLIVAVKDNIRPLGFRDQTGKLAGLEIEIARRLAQELLGNPEAAVLAPVRNEERLPAVISGEVDLAIARVTATAPRFRIASFSTPYYLDGTALITRRTDLRKVSELSGQTIAVLEGSSTIAVVRDFLPQAKLVGVPSYRAAHDLLESSSEVAAFAADASVLVGWVQEHPQYHLLPSLLSAEPLCIVMPKGLQYDSLRRTVNAAIAQWRRSGWLRQRADFWDLPLSLSDRFREQFLQAPNP